MTDRPVVLIAEELSPATVEALGPDFEIRRCDGADLAALLADPDACFFVCGLKAMEEGVVLALRDIATQAGLDWDTVGAALKREGRLHLETY